MQTYKLIYVIKFDIRNFKMNDLNDNKDIADKHDKDNGPKYFVTIEGVEHLWNQSTITTEQLATLGGWGTEGVIEIDKDNVERTLTAGELIELKPGHGFAKKVRWQRGDNLFENRLTSELAYLLGHFKEAKQHGMWYLIPQYPLPEGWNQKFVDVAFRIQPGYPSTPPYGFYVPAGTRFKETLPNNYQEAISDPPPFAGAWGMFSWAPAEWRPSDNLGAGFNLLNYALGFANRFKEGV